MMTRFSIGILLLAFAPAVVGAADDYRVTAASGSAAVWPAGAASASPATAGLPLNPGDRLLTGPGGSVEIGAANGSVMRLEENGAFSVEPPSSRWSAFRLGLGRLVAKFAPSPSRPYRISTPVAVAAIRGTELVLDVNDAGALQGGVVEGEVGFEPATETEAPTSSTETATVVVSTAEGVDVQPHAHPRKLPEIPPLLRPSLAAFPSLRERVPALRATWKELAPSDRETLRRDAFRARVKWEIPARLTERLATPSSRVAPPAVPALPRPAHRRD